MPRVTRSSTKTNALDHPMEPSAVDLKISRNHGKTIALEATPEHLQASKNAPIPDLSQRIHELTKENGRLRLELRYYQQSLEAIRPLPEDATFVVETMINTLNKVSKAQEEIEDDWARTFGVGRGSIRASLRMDTGSGRYGRDEGR
ncbi:hypothetical protein B0J14DRAFT_672007 [Halenospora varia]|nr:hypothetical protein B0J14DRAFT_672007 [Halenospora varia]